jgi:hypothetical protein
MGPSWPPSHILPQTPVVRRLTTYFRQCHCQVMLSELSKRRWSHSESQVTLNGKPALVLDALSSIEVIESISSPTEILPVEWIGWYREDWVSVRLAVTSRTHPRATPESPQHYMVCLRNMFDETRVGNPGAIEVRVTAKATGLKASVKV